MNNQVGSLLLKMLEKGNFKLAVAESLTAGKVSDLIASVEGISKYYQGSVTAYTCEIKNKVLDVYKVLLDKSGPYNNKTTHMMCNGVMRLMNADVAVATSGVAGPGNDGDTEEGMVYITVKIKEKTYDMHYQSTIKNDREKIREEAAGLARDLLISSLFNYLDMQDYYFQEGGVEKCGM